ncbi:MAG TPA: fused MFS/spermidine synthase [Prolixibacteraceae bacterium]|nr:fused MFS/spermidine synthase [Prolixibacteraceae bacterium]HPT30254.1 fused MFS/spermidine synthase [Prolixibacteraceae bacterium]
MKNTIDHEPESSIAAGMPLRWLLFLILLVEGASVMAVELTGTRLVAPFYGNSLYVWTAILCFSVGGLALGYYSGGLLSRRFPAPHLLYTILGVSALLVFALPYTARAIISFTSGMELIPGVSITGLVLMVPPMLCFGMTGPMVVRLMTSRLETLGNSSGITYFISTTGGILATFLFGLLLIPRAGISSSVRLTAILLALVSVLPILNLLLRKKNTGPYLSGEKLIRIPRQAAKRKKSPPPVKQSNGSLYLFAITEGGVVMAIELMAARMLAPWFGSSLHVWAIVMGLTLLGLAAGYFLGGWTADRMAGKTPLLTVLLLGSLLVMLMHPVSQFLPPLMGDIPFLLSLFITASLLILPPVLLFGMIPTLLIRQITRNVDDSGLTTGRVFTISSVSGILAVPLFGFWIIPALGLMIPSLITGLVAGAVPFVLLVRQKQKLGWLYIPVAILSLLMIREVENPPGIKVHHFSEGLLGQVMVADVNPGQAFPEGTNLSGRMLFVNRMGQSQIDLNSGTTRWNYLIFSSAISSILPEKSEALVLGLGGGMMAEKLSSDLGFDVDAVELDSRIAVIARQYFGLNDKVKVFVDDARHFMETTGKKYDLIFFDVFRGEVQPAHVLSLEAFKRTGDILTRNGMVIVNFNGYLNGAIGLPGRSLFATLQAAGFETEILPTPGNEDSRNSLFVASKNRIVFDALRTPLAYHGKEVRIDSLFLKPETLDLTDAQILTDDKPVLEWLNIKATAGWRKEYTRSFTSFFQKKGIPLFR